MRATSIVVCLALVLSCVSAADVLSVTVWNSWRPTNRVTFVREQYDRLYAVAGGAVVVWDISERRYVEWDERDGLGRCGSDVVVAEPDGSFWAVSTELVHIRDGTVLDRVFLGYLVSCSDIELDHQGTVWVAGSYGLFWYDGEYLDRSWRWGAAGSLTIGQDGSVWAATEAGLVRYCDGGWSCHNPPGQTVSFSLVEMDAGGEVWAVGRRLDWEAARRLYRFDGDRWDEFFIQPQDWHPTGIAIDSGGLIWMSCWEGVIVFDRRDWMSFSSIDGQPLTELECVCASEDGQSIWLGTRCDGLYRVRGDQVERWLTDAPITSSPCAVAMEKNKLWAGMDRTRLASYSEGRWEMVTLVPDAGYYSWIDSISVSPDGTKWLCCYGIGLLKYAEGAVSIYDSSNSPLGQYLGPVKAAADGTVWVWDSWNGLWRFDGSQWTLHDSATGFPLFDVVAISEAPDGTLWVAGTPGICSFDGSEWRHYGQDNSPIQDEYRLYSIACGPDGAVYVGSFGFLFCLRGSEWSVYHPGNSPLVEGRIDALAATEDGLVWIGMGHPEITLYRLKGGNWQSFTPDDSPLLSRRSITAMAAWKGHIWFSSRAGLSYRREVPGELRVYLSVERQGAYHRGRSVRAQLVLRASCENPIGDVWGDVYLWVECPDGSCYFLPSLSQEPERLARKVHFPDGLKLDNLPIFTCDASSVPPGRYTFRLIIMNRNSKTEPLSNIASCEWEFEK